MRNSNLKQSEITNMVVYRTRNYNLFKIMEENRELDASHLKQLTASIKEHGQYVPVIVDPTGRVIDGQHRMKSCKELGIPVLYIIRELDINDVSEMNSKSRNWKLDDYLHNWSKRGYTEYQRLTELIKDNQDLELLVTNYITIFGATDSAQAQEDFRNGKFKIANEKRGKEVLNLYRKIKKYYYGNVNNIFLRTLALLSVNPKFDITHFVNKLKQKPFEKVNSNNGRDYLRAVEDIYNYRVRNNNFVTF